MAWPESSIPSDIHKQNVPAISFLIFPLEQREKGMSVHLWFGWKFNPGVLENGGGEVNIESHVFNAGARLDQLGMAGEHGDANRFLEGIAFVVESMFAKGKSIVSQVNEQGIICYPKFIQLNKDTADIFIECVYGFAKVVIKLIEVRNGSLSRAPVSI